VNDDGGGRWLEGESGAWDCPLELVAAAIKTGTIEVGRGRVAGYY
jgi:hypothetical protein